MSFAITSNVKLLFLPVITSDKYVVFTDLFAYRQDKNRN
jgi:hypothetical protein